MPTERHERALWFAVVGAPAAWSLDLLTAFVIEKSYCMAPGSGLVSFGGVSLWLALSGALATAIGAAAAATAWRMRVRFRAHGPGATPVEDRRRFMANAALAISVIFLFATILRLIAPWFVDAALCGPTG